MVLPIVIICLWVLLTLIPINVFFFLYVIGGAKVLILFYPISRLCKINCVLHELKFDLQISCYTGFQTETGFSDIPCHKHHPF